MKQLSQKRADQKLLKELKRERKNAQLAPHYSNTSNPVDFPVTRYVHIVQVHPVENGEVNGYKVRSEKEFTNREEAVMYVDWFNTRRLVDPTLERTKAVYLGRVNDETGELE